MSILKGLELLKAENLCSLHMPGHKGRLKFPDIMNNIGEIDITEIPGSDNLHKAQGMILAAQERAARIFGAEKTYFLINGTTGGILSMMLSQCRPKDKILVPRNCHRSVWNGLILGDLIPIYIQPKIHPKTGIGLSISPEDVEEKLREHPDIKAALITYPTFYGSCSDLKKIRELLYAKNKLLLVDEAHGAHFAFHKDLPLTALESGGDIVAQSTHKMLSSFTQSSMLHVGNSRSCSMGQLEMFLALLQSTSPSYPLMASLEFAALEAEREGYIKWDNIIEWNQSAIEEITKETSFKIVGKDLIGKHGVVDYDISRFLIDVSSTGLSGLEVDRILRKNFGIQVELSDYYHILAMTGMGTEYNDIERFTKGLIEIYNQYKGRKQEKKYFQLPLMEEKVILSPRDAIYSPEERVKFEESIGRISKEFIIPYPPGIPIILPGEEITPDIIDRVKHIKSWGGEIIGTQDNKLNTINVVVEN
ncbi:MAG TPA: aminotransferase class I/II-fold pyridoxal phosphate-dependent enzyme [Eubacteriaceae bacterium]|nr:aminotransferase class I/II-fold pyridoxal phosphate-dependent enzyme [Eubacteriaceae bacterium]